MLIPFAIDINLFYRFSFVFFVLFKKQKRPPKRTAVIFEPPNPKDTGGQTGKLFYGSLITSPGWITPTAVFPLSLASSL